MDLKAKYLSENCSDPIEFLHQLRQTTEPIGGDTVYSEDGELVEYDVAVEAIKKATDAFIERASQFLYDYNQKQVLKHGARATLGCGEYTINVDEFRKYMKGENE